MVHFTNITFDEDWVYADAYDSDNNARGKIKVHRRKELFYTDCTSFNVFMKASWTMRRDVNKGKIKQNGERVVAWG